MARRKARTTVADEAPRPAAKNEVVHEVAALLASIDSLSQSWPKGPDGQPVRLGDASMPKDVADRIGQALQSASGSVTKAAVLLGQHTLGRVPDAEPTRQPVLHMPCSSRRPGFSKTLASSRAIQPSS